MRRRKPPRQVKVQAPKPKLERRLILPDGRETKVDLTESLPFCGAELRHLKKKLGGLKNIEIKGTAVYEVLPNCKVLESEDGGKTFREVGRTTPAFRAKLVKWLEGWGYGVH